MKNLKKVLLFLTAVCAVSFGNNVKKDNKDEMCKDKDNKTVKCPVKVKDNGEMIKKGDSKQNGMKKPEKSKTEKKKKERATSSK
ncbi:MAG: hypothetical protein Q4D53_02155 [Leptotrichiaceae bacterium]|nr:hypothetical protein [Leptotrichiaceae bacterium]